MTNKSFPILNSENAPEASRPLMDMAQKKFGMVPNILGTLAASPTALKSYMGLSANFMGASSMTAIEEQVVLIATSTWNDCGY